jgi:hypothetical protein
MWSDMQCSSYTVLQAGNTAASTNAVAVVAVAVYIERLLHVMQKPLAGLAKSCTHSMLLRPCFIVLQRAAMAAAAASS